MTALKEYERLESGGLWRSGTDAQRRDVGVAFGDATLVISDNAGRPLAHWSLPAVERLNQGVRPALYAPDTEAAETLEIEDDLMIDAIEKVRRHIARGRAKPGRLRQLGGLAIFAVVLGVALIWLPGALTRQTLSVVPLAKRSEIGAALLGHIQRLTGPTCRSPLGVQALDRLKTRVLGADTPGQIVVVPGELAAPVILPGRIIVLGRAMVELPQDPAAVAGMLLAATTAIPDGDPLEPVLADAGLAMTLRLLTTGDLPPDVLASYAEAALRSPAPAPDTNALLTAFADAGIPSTPYAYALDPTGETTLPLIENDPMAGVATDPILRDSAWVSLQGICSG